MPGKAVSIVKESLRPLRDDKMLDLFAVMQDQPHDKRDESYRLVRACVLDLLEEREVISYDGETSEYIFPDQVRVPLSVRP